MTTAQVIETSVTVNNNSPIQDYVHLDDQTQPTFEMTPGFKTFHIISNGYRTDRSTSHDAGLEITTDTVANATSIFSLAT